MQIEVIFSARKLVRIANFPIIGNILLFFLSNHFSDYISILIWELENILNQGTVTSVEGYDWPIAG